MDHQLLASKLIPSLMPRPPSFLFLRLCSVLYTEAEERRKMGKVGKHDVTWTQGGCGGEVPDYNYMCTKPKSKCLTSQVEYLQSCEPLGFCPAMEHLMMKYSTVFECTPLLPYIRLMSLSVLRP